MQQNVHLETDNAETECARCVNRIGAERAGFALPSNGIGGQFVLAAQRKLVACLC